MIIKILKSYHSEVCPLDTDATVKLVKDNHSYDLWNQL